MAYPIREEGGSDAPLLTNGFDQRHLPSRSAMVSATGLKSQVCVSILFASARVISVSLLPRIIGQATLFGEQEGCSPLLNVTQFKNNVDLRPSV